MILPDKVLPLSKVDRLDITTVTDKNNLLLLCTAQTVDIPVQHTANLPYSALINDMSAVVNTVIAPYLYNLSFVPSLIVEINQLKDSINKLNNETIPAFNYKIAAMQRHIETIDDEIAELRVKIEDCCKK